jgi:predicted transposase YbfD/YdcC
VRTRLPTRLDRNWPGITAIRRIERLRETRDRCSREVIYAITSLSADRLDAASLLRLSRDHWQIENRLFLSECLSLMINIRLGVRDVTFKEDASRVRTGSAPQVMAELRNATLSIIRRKNQKPRPAREAFAARPKIAIRQVMTA